MKLRGSAKRLQRAIRQFDKKRRKECEDAQWRGLGFDGYRGFLLEVKNRIKLILERGTCAESAESAISDGQCTCFEDE